jgi:hypothetical protein
MKRVTGIEIRCQLHWNNFQPSGQLLTTPLILKNFAQRKAEKLTLSLFLPAPLTATQKGHSKYADHHAIISILELCVQKL